MRKKDFLTRFSILNRLNTKLTNSKRINVIGLSYRFYQLPKTCPIYGTAGIKGLNDILKSIYRPGKIFSRKIKIGKNSRRSNLGGLIKFFFKFSKITLGPTLLNLPDRTESLITGVGKFL